MASERSQRGLELIDVKDERVRTARTSIDVMSDGRLRELVCGEPPIVVEAAEGIIARRHATEQP